MADDHQFTNDEALLRRERCPVVSAREKHPRTDTLSPATLKSLAKHACAVSDSKIGSCRQRSYIGALIFSTGLSSIGHYALTNTSHSREICPEREVRALRHLPVMACGPLQNPDITVGLSRDLSGR